MRTYAIGLSGIITLLITLFHLSVSLSDVAAANQKMDVQMTNDKMGGLFFVAVITEAPEIRKGPGLSGVVLPFKPKFLDVLPVYDISPDKNNPAFYFIKMDNKWGWISRKDVLDDNICLRSEEKENPAFIKIVAKNNWRLGNQNNVKDVPILIGPGSNYSTIKKIDIYKHRYAYRYSEDRQYIFVGTSPVWKQNDAREKLEGWISSDLAIEWNHQIAVYFNKNAQERKEPVYIFKEKEDLADYIQTKQIPNDPKIKEKKILAEEVLDFSKEVTPETTRFPVVGKDKIENHDVYKIAWVGEALNRPLNGGNNIVSRQEVDRKRKDANDAIEQSRKINMMILIDATNSMHPYYRTVAAGLKTYFDKLSEDDYTRFSFALAVYRDFKDDFRFQILSDFTQYKNANEFSNDIKSASDECGVSILTDVMEDGYYGIYRAVNEADWNEKNLINSLVVIGDASSHENSGLIDGKPVTDEILSDLLAKKRITLYGMTIGEDGMKYKKQLDNLSRKVHEKIISDAKQRGDIDGVNELTQKGVQGYIVQIDETKVKDKTMEFMKDVVDFSTQTSYALHANLFDGADLKTIESKYGVRVTNYMLAIIRDFLIKKHQIQDMTAYSQICDYGWVSYKSLDDNYVQLTPYVLMNRFKLQSLIGFFANTIYELNFSKDKISLILYNLSDKTVGDPILENETIAEYIQRIWHIPFINISPTLHFSLKDLEDKFENSPAFREDLKKNILNRLQYYEMVMQNKFGKVEWDNASESYQLVNPKPKEWWYLGDDMQKYCWLPFEYLP